MSNYKVKSSRSSSGGGGSSNGLGILWLFAILYPFVVYLDYVLKVLGIAAIIILLLKAFYMYRNSRKRRIKN